MAEGSGNRQMVQQWLQSVEKARPETPEVRFFPELFIIEPHPSPCSFTESGFLALGQSVTADSHLAKDIPTNPYQLHQGD